MNFKETLRRALNATGYDISKRPALLPVEVRSGAQREVSADIVDDILEFFDAVPYFYEPGIPAPLEIGGAWRYDLIARRRNHIAAVEQRDREGLRNLLTNMFFNELVAGLKGYGYYEGQTRCHPLFPGVCRQFEFVTGLKLENVATMPSLPIWGVPVGNGRIATYEDSTHASQAWSVEQILGNFLRPRDVPVVVDLGSGYGGMAVKIASQHEGAIDIILIDIPANLTTAYAYLANQYGRESVKLFRNADAIAKIGPNESNKPRMLLVPTILTEDLVKRFLVVDVVHNGGSFSEMDMATIAFYMDALVSHSKCLIETNSNSLTLNAGGHIEVANSSFPVPASHRLIARYSPLDAAVSDYRYLTNIYLVDAARGSFLGV